MINQEQFNKAWSPANSGDVNYQLVVARYYRQHGDINSAKIWLEKAGNQENRNALFELAELLLDEYERSVRYPYLSNNANLAKILDLYQRAYDKGLIEAKDALQPGSKNHQLIAKFAEQNKDKDAMFKLGCMHESGKYVSGDIEKAIFWHEKAANLGHNPSQNNLGCIHYRKRDYKSAFQWFEKAVLGCNSYAYNNLGTMYHDGVGTAKDLKKAEQCYKKSIQICREYALPYHKLGSIYESYLEDAKKAPQNFMERYKIEEYKRNIISNYQEAAKLDHTVSQSRLGVIYYQDQKYTNAKPYLEKAAEKKDATAQCYLAKMYDIGSGVVKDPAIAFSCYQKAAIAGNVEAQYELGRRYESKQNWLLAFEWFLKASAQKSAAARNKLGDSDNIIARYNRLYVILDNNIERFKKYLQFMHSIGYAEFRDPGPFIRALTRKKDPVSQQAQFERLEFVGDRVLNLIIADYLEQNTDKTILVDQLNDAFRLLTENHGALCMVAKQIKLGQYLIGEHIQASQEVSANMLADAMEAVIAAIYRDLGFVATKKIVINLWQLHINKALQEAQRQSDNAQQNIAPTPMTLRP